MALEGMNNSGFMTQSLPGSINSFELEKAFCRKSDIGVSYVF
jgi:hypothetical protein